MAHDSLSGKTGRYTNTFCQQNPRFREKWGWHLQVDVSHAKWRPGPQNCCHQRQAPLDRPKSLDVKARFVIGCSKNSFATIYRKRWNKGINPTCYFGINFSLIILFVLYLYLCCWNKLEWPVRSEKYKWIHLGNWKGILKCCWRSQSFVLPFPNMSTKAHFLSSR